MKAVIYDFKPGRSGAHAREFLGDWRGSLMCDDYAGYKALFASGQVIEGGCWAHARRKFHDIYKPMAVTWLSKHYGKFNGCISMRQRRKT